MQFKYMMRESSFLKMVSQQGIKSILYISKDEVENVLLLENANFNVTAYYLNQNIPFLFKDCRIFENTHIIVQCGMDGLLPYAENAFDGIILDVSNEDVFTQLQKSILYAIKNNGIIYVQKSEKKLFGWKLPVGFCLSYLMEEGFMYIKVSKPEPSIMQYEQIIGKYVVCEIDRPVGSRHPKFPYILYPINYGYVIDIMASDGENQDVYIIGENKPIRAFQGFVVAVIHRLNDNEDKWVVASDIVKYSKDFILNCVEFQEKYFDIKVFT